MKKRNLRTFVIVALCAVLLGGASLAYAFSSREFIGDNPKQVIPLSDGSALIADRMSQSDIDGLMETITDGNGEYLENHLDLRNQFVLERDNFQVMTKDGRLVEAESEAFSAKLHNNDIGEFEHTFYKIRTGHSVYILPSELDALPFEFLVNEQADSFFACTDTGIYRINPESLDARLLTSIAYDSEPYDQLAKRFAEAGGWNLFWVSNPVVSPTGQWIVYQSNRNYADSLPAEGVSLWLLDTKTGHEQLLTASRDSTQSAEGFMSSNALLIAEFESDGAGDKKYMLINVESGAQEPLVWEQLPNAYIDAICGKGFIALQSYDDSGIREHIVGLADNGYTDTVAVIEGMLHNVSFSPSGKQVAAIMREDKGTIIDTILIIDTSNGSIIERNDITDGAILTNLAWVSDGHLLITEVTNEKGDVHEASWLYEIGAGNR